MKVCGQRSLLKFRVLNDRYWRSIQIKYWIVVNSSKVSKVNELCFGLGKFETIFRGPIFNSVYALLKMPLYCSYVF